MARLDAQVIGAVARKDLRTALGNPTGYVFLTLFVGLTAAAAFLQDAFFSRNLADLALLNRYMPEILVLFVPALTMGAWADERRAGTDELLLTLPVRDGEVVLGKYLGALGMFTIALGFSIVHVVVLSTLGTPDPGLIFSTYLGYWMMGVLFVAVGLLASMMTANPTVAFVLGVLGCGGLVVGARQAWAAGLLGVAVFAGFGALVALVLRPRAPRVGIGAGIGAGSAALWWGTDLATRLAGDADGAVPAFESLFSLLAVPDHFAPFGEGVIQLGDVTFFVAFAAVLLYLSAFLLGRRHW
ncbi:MAG: hypothetical protein D6705_05315 [Deltaproteobacteria bacterium]|nr:MAG: hypothetical protein D6705_05315 [Deltaproteobacteria bacterium]